MKEVRHGQNRKGEAELEWARQLLASAKTADELPEAQAIILPLDLGLSLEQTAQVIGRSVSLTCKLRNRTRREKAGELVPRKRKRDLRNHAAATIEREAAILDELLKDAAHIGVVVIPRLLPAFEKALGKKVALSTLNQGGAIDPQSRPWRGRASASWRPTPSIRKVTRRRARTGKKTPPRTGESRSWRADRPTAARDVS